MIGLLLRHILFWRDSVFQTLRQGFTIISLQLVYSVSIVIITNTAASTYKPGQYITLDFSSHLGDFNEIIALARPTAKVKAYIITSTHIQYL